MFLLCTWTLLPASFSSSTYLSRVLGTFQSISFLLKIFNEEITIAYQPKILQKFENLYFLLKYLCLIFYLRVASVKEEDWSVRTKSKTCVKYVLAGFIKI